MKRILVLLIALSASALTFAQTGKVGHANFQEIMLAMPERADAEAELQAVAKEYESQLNTMKTEYQKKIQDFQNAGAALPESIQNVKVQEIQNLEQQIVQLEQQAQVDLAQMENDLLQPMIEKVNNAVEAVAKAEGYAYVIDSSAGVLLYAGGTDLSDKVKTNLGISASSTSGE